jgi:membrane protein YqaA with SNARE-associated domain
MLGATILPIPTEASLVMAMKMKFNLWHILGIASLGNCLGAYSNYILGAYFSDRVQKQLDSPSGKKARAWLEHYGGWAMIFSWAPFVGDPMCVVAGAIRMRWTWFSLGLLSRVARYAVFIWLVGYLKF